MRMRIVDARVVCGPRWRLVIEYERDLHDGYSMLRVCLLWWHVVWYYKGGPTR